MKSKLWSRKGVALAAAVVASAGAAALLSWNVMSPEPVSSAALGPDWQCSRVAFVLTTCTRTGDTVTGAIPVRAKDDCPPPEN
ncbi:hypothetical protein [Bradyrhizobium genosp. P]|uniref:hypothetical protein n=1 Tax=Bradyrhizobium genosp. P TaxID=83641 RepID=UPI003CF80213